MRFPSPRGFSKVAPIWRTTSNDAACLATPARADAAQVSGKSAINIEAISMFLVFVLLTLGITKWEGHLLAGRQALAVAGGHVAGKLCFGHGVDRRWIAAFVLDGGARPKALGNRLAQRRQTFFHHFLDLGTVRPHGTDHGHMARNDTRRTGIASL